MDNWKPVDYSEHDYQFTRKEQDEIWFHAEGKESRLIASLQNRIAELETTIKELEQDALCFDYMNLKRKVAELEQRFGIEQNNHIKIEQNNHIKAVAEGNELRQRIAELEAQVNRTCRMTEGPNDEWYSSEMTCDQCGTLQLWHEHLNYCSGCGGKVVGDG